MRASFSWSWFAFSVALVCVVPTAWSQPADGVKSAGIRTGNLEIHPGIGASLGYDSNVFLDDDNAALNEEPQGSGVLRVGPYIYLSTLGEKRLQSDAPPKVRFRAGANGNFKHFFAFSDQTDFGIGQDAKLTLQPSPYFALDLFDEFNRTIDPVTDAVVGSTGETVGSQRDQLGLGARLQLSTAGGLLEGGLGYRFDLDHFEDDLFESNGSTAHSLLADTSWEFVPLTELFWNGSIKFHSYGDTGTMLADSPERNDSTQLDSRLGINGALTKSIGFTVAGGYGAGFFADNSDFESFIVEVEGRFRLADNVNFSLGYDREFQPAFQGNFSRVDRVKTRLHALAGARWAFGAKAELSLVSFGHDDNLPGPDRRDQHLHAGLNAEYKMLEWLALTGDLGYSQNFTDYVYVLMGPDDPAKYQRFEAWFGLRAFL